MKNNQEEYIQKFKMELTMMMGKGQKIHKNFLLEGITHSEFFALQQIHCCMAEESQDKGIYASELAKSLHIASSAVSRMLNNLEERGLVYREIDAKNRRNIRVFLTKKGEQLRKSCSADINQLLERVIFEMGEKDAVKLIELWKKFSDLMEKEVSAMVQTKKQK